MSQKKNLKYLESVKYYIENSSIHGLWYIANARNAKECFMWSVSLVLCFSLAFHLIYQFAVQWNESPAVTSVDVIPVDEVTFPAVTVCYDGNTNYRPILEYLKTRKLSERSAELMQIFLQQLEYRRKAEELYGKNSFRYLFSTQFLASKFKIKEITKKMIGKACEDLNSTMCLFYRTALSFDKYKVRKINTLRLEREIIYKRNGTSTKAFLEQLRNKYNVILLDGLDMDKLLQSYNIKSYYSPQKIYELFLKTDSNKTFDTSRLQDAGSHQLVQFLMKANLLSRYSNTLLQKLLVDEAVDATETFMPSLASNMTADSFFNFMTWALPDIVTYQLLSDQDLDCLKNSRCNGLSEDSSPICRSVCDLVDYYSVPGNFEELMLNMRLASNPAHFDREAGLGRQTYSASVAMIPQCFWNSNIVGFRIGNYSNEFCDSFRPTVTDNGICYTFNKFSSLREGSAYGEVFERTFLRDQSTPPLRTITGTGTNFGMKIILDKNYKIGQSPNSNFVVHVHSPDDFPQILNEFVANTHVLKTRINIGINYFKSNNIIKVNALVKTRTTSSFDNMNIKARKCIKKDEMKLKFFQPYTKKNCELECRIERASGECGCTPWNFPSDLSQLCEPSGNICFRKKIRYLTLLGNSTEPCLTVPGAQKLSE